MWVTLTEHKWVTLGERRGLPSICLCSLEKAERLVIRIGERRVYSLGHIVHLGKPEIVVFRYFLDLSISSALRHPMRSDHRFKHEPNKRQCGTVQTGLH